MNTEERRAKQLALARSWKARNREKVRAYRAKYWQENKEKESAQSKAWFKKNADKKPAFERVYRERNAAKISERRKTPAFKQAKNAKAKARYHSDTAFKIQKCLRASLLQAVRMHGNGKKAGSVQALIGCTMAELFAHLEQQFKPGMSWANHGAWHIDHRLPCASFNLLLPEQQRACFHFKNLQPLWPEENLKKQDMVLP